MTSSPFVPIRWQYSADLPYSLMAGPCSAETEYQVMAVAHRLRQLGVRLFRASLWKPRTRPGGFEGVGEVGIPWLQRVQQELEMQVATEVATPAHIEQMLGAGLNTFWIGARTTSSPFAVTEIAEALRGSDATVLVKNPINPDIELWEGALLRLASCGITNIGAIHRGFSTYGESIYRNSPLWQIPIELKRRHPELCILADPSHIGGKRSLIEPLSRFSLDMRFDGLLIETHCNPDDALSDSAQQITPEQLSAILSRLKVPVADTEDDALRALRQDIDRIDRALLGLLAERMAVATRIGEHKSMHNLCVLQPERYRWLMEQRLALGSELGLSEHLVHELFSSIHEASVLIQSHQ